MYGLPDSSTVNRRIPKKKFFENLNISPSMRRCFVEDIQAIYWRNKIDSRTTNLANGEIVDEIQVFEIQLSQPNLNENILRQIDKEIPYHIIFLLEYAGKYQVWAVYKEETASRKNAFKVGSYYHTEWLPESELPLKIDGHNIDTVYENFVRQIAGDTLQRESGETLKESVERDIRRQKLEHKIEKVEAAAWKETQPKKRFDLYSKLQKYKQELEELKHGQS